MGLEYFWETEYKFGEFLKKIFGDSYKRKYSLEGNGIFNLLYLNGKIYEVKYGECKSKLQNDNHKFTDDKEFIINTIVDNLKCDKEKIVINSGKFITFPIDKWTAKCEIIKKIKEPV
jgi:hypothetical protein